tara:strand:- start:2625 stop:3149 length:525 start_codon:yes stop_codon:yes gene_type:complete
MNIDLQILGLLLNVISYLFIFFLIFNLLKVNYFNPIVSTFVKVYKPLSKVFFIFPNQIINILLFAIIFKLLSLMVYFSNQYEILTLLGVAIVQVFMAVLRIIFFNIIGGVILSWVRPKNSNAFLQLIEEISDKSLAPIRKFIPSAGGLDFSPLFVLILINLLESFLTDILRAIV